MSFNTQFLYLIVTESITGAVVAAAAVILMVLIHRCYPAVSYGRAIGWLTVAAFLLPIWYVGKYIRECVIPYYLYEAISGDMWIFGGSRALEIPHSIVMSLWIAGIFGGGGILIWRQVQVSRILKKAVPVRDPSILYELEEIQENLGICKDVRILHIPNIPSPGCAGVRKPCIVLNDSAMNHENVRAVLCHELIHIKCQDVMFRHILDLVAVLHWFNPMVHIFRSVMIRQMEYGCDRYVLTGIGWGIGSGEYIETISRVVKRKKGGWEYFLPFGGREESTGRRIGYLRRITFPSSIRSLAAMLVTVGVLLGASFTAYGANSAVTNIYEEWLHQEGFTETCEGGGEQIPGIQEVRTTWETDVDGLEEKETYVKNEVMGLCWQLQPGEAAVSTVMNGTSGEDYGIFLTPQTGKTARVGLMMPDGLTRWLEADQASYYSGQLSQNGTFRIIVENLSDCVNEVSVSLMQIEP